MIVKMKFLSGTVCIDACTAKRRDGYISYGR